MQNALHKAIISNNILAQPTRSLQEYFRSHKTVYKVVLVANHLFRAASMAALMMFVPHYSNAACFGGSLFYRLTVETNCAYKFALPAWVGSMAFLIGKNALTNLASLSSLLSLALLPAWGAYVVLTVSYDVDARFS